MTIEAELMMLREMIKVLTERINRLEEFNKMLVLEIINKNIGGLK